MTFDEILDQVREMLQSKGRMSYRALKRRFDLDDEYLEDLKAELIKAEGVAADENGEVLVWVGKDSLNQTTRHWDTYAASCESTAGVVCAAWRASTAAVTSGV